MISKKSNTLFRTVGNTYKKNTAIQPVYIKYLKRGIWLYFLLLIFEGALRKWVLPGLASPLLIIRDPIALYIVLVALQKKLLSINGYLFFIVFIGIVGFITAIAFGHGSFVVAIFGARILLIHFPLMFVIGRVLTRDDVVKMGLLTLCIAIPMTVLIAMQFYSPQTAWVNTGIGGEETVGFTGALGFFRPSGTFSFTNGLVLFYGLVAAFLAYFAIDKKAVSKFLVLGSAIALIAAIPLSISRTVLFQAGLTFVFLIIAVSRKPKYLGRLLAAGIGMLLVLFILNQTDFFQGGAEVFTARFDSANQQEGGLENVFLDRFLGGLIGALFSKNQLAFFGGGIGLGTNVGSKILVGERGFIIDEGEWARIIGELGFFLGIIVIFVRVSLVLKFAKDAYLKVVKGDLLPWMLLSFGFIIVAQGSWAQPTSLGFSTLIGGLILASLKKRAI